MRFGEYELYHLNYILTLIRNKLGSWYENAETAHWYRILKILIY